MAHPEAALDPKASPKATGRLVAGKGDPLLANFKPLFFESSGPIMRQDPVLEAEFKLALGVQVVRLCDASVPGHVFAHVLGELCLGGVQQLAVLEGVSLASKQRGICQHHDMVLPLLQVSQVVLHPERGHNLQ